MKCTLFVLYPHNVLYTSVIFIFLYLYNYKREQLTIFCVHVATFALLESQLSSVHNPCELLFGRYLHLPLRSRLRKRLRVLGCCVAYIASTKVKNASAQLQIFVLACRNSAMSKYRTDLERKEHKLTRKFSRFFGGANQ